MNKTNYKPNNLSNDLIESIKLVSKKCFPLNNGDLLFKEGDEKEFIYLIDKGEVSLIKNNQLNDVELIKQHDGDIVGVDLIFNDAQCEYSALVKKPTLLYKILISDFKSLLIKNNKSSIELIKYLSSLINQMETKRINLTI